MVGPDIGAPGAVALFQAQPLDRAVAGIGDAVFLARRHQRVVDAQGKLDGNVQLPAELADIGDAKRKHRRPGEVMRFTRPKGKPAFDMSCSVTPEHVARPRTHHREHGIGRGDIDQPGIEPIGNVARIQSKSCVAKPVPVTM